MLCIKSKGDVVLDYSNKRYARKIKQLYRLKHKQTERIAKRKLSTDEYESLLLCPTYIKYLMDEDNAERGEKAMYLSVIHYLRFGERMKSIEANLKFNKMI